MLKSEKVAALAAPSVASYHAGGYTGLLIKEINLTGCYDTIIFKDTAEEGIRSVHCAMVYYDTARPYFKYYGRRIHLDECIKTWGV